MAAVAGTTARPDTTAFRYLDTGKALPPLPPTQSLHHTAGVPTEEAIGGNQLWNKRLAPGVEERLQRLEEQKRRQIQARRSRYSIGHLPEEQLQELERLQQARDQSLEVVRHGRTWWTGPPVRVAMPSTGGVRLSGGPVLTDTEQSILDTDVSSIISFSEGVVPSDSEAELRDTRKYRLPSPGKTRLHLRTKEPLSPTPRQTVRSPATTDSNETPPTPRMRPSPARHASTASVEHLGRSAHPKRTDSADNVNASDSDFVGSGLSRTGSIYTLSRASFEGQLSKLTSMRLPDANSLAKRIASLPTAGEAAKALTDASDQIRMWISRASEVLNGLSAEDDVEWAAAGGREGIEDVDKAINRFERLVQVYILSIERLQTRDDLGALSSDELTGTVMQMDEIIQSWSSIKKTLKGVKEQVEIAMEWEELWNTVLGEIGQEMEGLERLVFEMEEKRHDGAASVLSGAKEGNIDLNELETIVEEQPKGLADKRQSINRLSIFQPFSPKSPMEPLPTFDGKEDSNENNLLALFARMQPLRASLDFLPMRLAAFLSRGNDLFPTACQDLESRREYLEKQWKKLEGDAESLRRELGEDRWVLVFRNAGRQALKMCESVARSYYKLKDAMENGEQAGNMPSLTKKVESYEAKKTHYGPAIERVLSIIDRGVMDRLTVNGEILRLQSDMKRRWSALQADMREVDLQLEEIAVSDGRDKQLRDSISTVMSSEPSRSLASSTIGGSVDTPGSSPASSVINGDDSRKNSFQGSRTPTPLVCGKLRQSSLASSTHRGTPTSAKLSNIGSIPRKPVAGLSPASALRSPANTPSPLTSKPEPMNKQPQWPSRAPLQQDTNKPKWTSSTKSENRDFLPLSALEPSPYAKTPVPKRSYGANRAASTPAGPASKPATTAPAVRNVSTPISVLPRPAASTTTFTTRKSSLPVNATAGASNTLTPAAARASSRPSSRLTSGRRSALRLDRSSKAEEASDGNDADTESPLVTRAQRPPSALSSATAGASAASASAQASGRRSSMLPTRLPGDVRSARPPSAGDNSAAKAKAGVNVKRPGVGGGGAGGGGAGGAGATPLRPASKLDVGKAMAAAAEEERPRWA